VRDLLVGSSAVLSNGNVADDSILERFGSKSCEVRGTYGKIRLRLFRFGD